VAEHNTDVGNTNDTSILPRKSKHMDQLVTVVRDQAAPSNINWEGRFSLNRYWKSFNHSLKEKGQPEFSKNGIVLPPSVNITFLQY